MSILKKVLTTVAVTSLMLSASVATAETFKFAFQGDVQSLDPHGLNETFTLGFLSNVYEGLTMLDKDIKLVPGLATSWENTSQQPSCLNSKRLVSLLITHKYYF